jgi:chemotaxis protein MotB
VAYGDFITTMLALFIVLWASNQSPQVRQAIGAYFRNPGVVTEGGASAVLSGGTGILPMQAAPAAAESTEPPADARTLETAAKQLAELIRAERELRGLRDQIWIEVTPEGLRIQLMEKDDSLFFDIGSATLKPATRRLLGLIARMAGRLPNEVVIEGHTDSRPYQGGLHNYSNWELSSDRANAARRAMEENGLRPRQVTHVVGYADHQLLNPADPYDAQNRRVSIIIQRRTHDDPEAKQLAAEVDRLSRGVAKNSRRDRARAE